MIEPPLSGENNNADMSIYIITIHAGFDDSSTLNEVCYLSDLYSTVVIIVRILRWVFMVTPEENHYLVAQMVFKICKPKNVTKVYNAALRVINSVSIFFRVICRDSEVRVFWP